MNSLNLLSASVLGHNRPAIKRTQSTVDTTRRNEDEPAPLKRAHSHYSFVRKNEEDERGGREIATSRSAASSSSSSPVEDDIKIEKKEDEELGEKSLLLGRSSETSFTLEGKPARGRIQILFQKLVGSFTDSVRWFFGKLFAPGLYIASLFYAEDGHFSPFMPLYRLTGKKGRKPGPKASLSGRKATERRQLRSSRPRSSSPGSSESEGDRESIIMERSGEQLSSSDESTTSRRSIRIKQNSESVRQRKKKKDLPEEALAKELKSPTSPASSLKMARYPHAPHPPRPLIPRRQPSYSSKAPQPTGLPQKTLVLDLDETLIHSMAKGGRMSTGHMVEVKLAAPTAYNGVALGPQHPILYYVHKRPHCDEFLRLVSKWYNLVVFTASVQEYADPVIDWLELERKYFSKRYYRQDCTFRTGAYIKDLGSIEPDLSRVMILDNSPLSYIFHEDNAIPIEGWINDPTDNDLMHLIPLLEALQYVTDVRAFLGLRRGEIDQSQAKR